MDAHSGHHKHVVSVATRSRTGWYSGSHLFPREIIKWCAERINVVGCPLFIDDCLQVRASQQPSARLCGFGLPSSRLGAPLSRRHETDQLMAGAVLTSRNVCLIPHGPRSCWIPFSFCRQHIYDTQAIVGVFNTPTPLGKNGGASALLVLAVTTARSSGLVCR